LAAEWPPPPRPKPLEIAVPASMLTIEPSLELKTLKAGIVGRAAGAFRVDKIHVYIDRAEAWDDAETFKRILEYMATPPYLRKRLYPGSDPRLRYAGVLPPLQLPTHGVGGPKEGEVREALVLRRRGRVAVVDAGLGKPVEVDLPEGVRVERGERILVKIVSLQPVILDMVEPGGVYRGYTVEKHDSLSALARRVSRGYYRIATSRQGRLYLDALEEIRRGWGERERIVILFGSPREGLREIAEREGLSLDDIADIVVNTVPRQGTLTIRTEEAVWASLAALNQALPG